MNEELSLFTVALKMTPGVGDISAKQLISYCGSVSAIFNEKKGALLKIPGIGAKTVASILSAQPRVKAEAIMANCAKHDISVIPYFDHRYPEKLKLVNDAPLLIYTKGKSDFQQKKIVGIVGTRNATEYGKQMTADIVSELVPHDAVIVSGLAYGIDIAAHRAAVQHNLSTIAVLAGGLDSIYPAAHKKTAQDMLELGGQISEQKPETQPEAHYFPARNRIIAGMSDALIVVEAASRGGALITANIAYSYDREVFAVPGDLVHKYSEGCNALLRAQKASIYTSVKDLEYILGWEKGADKPTPKADVDLSSFSEREQKIMKVLADFEGGLHLDELSWKSQINVNEVLSTLLHLEFAGLIKSMPGKRFVRI